MRPTAQQKEVQLFMERARQMLNVAEHNLGDDFYESSVNRSYYAAFYAASALLTTQDKSMSRHSGVVSAFRQHFVKAGIFAVEYSDIYGRLLDHRSTSDYDLLVSINKAQATEDLRDAYKFVDAVQQWLKQEGWL
jgi:uncharacterized protein